MMSLKLYKKVLANVTNEIIRRVNERVDGLIEVTVCERNWTTKTRNLTTKIRNWTREKRNWPNNFIRVNIRLIKFSGNKGIWLKKCKFKSS